MSCKNKNNDNKNKDKNIICKTCICTKAEDNKLKIECKDCDDEKDIIIICESCESETDDNKTKLCLKDCECDYYKEATMHITCDNYKEDLD